MNKLVITNIPEYKNYLISARFENDKIALLDCDDLSNRSLLGNIYIGKVKNIVKNIQAAFIEIEKGRECYYSLEENKNPIFTSFKKNNKLCVGDELVVQVAKENIKTKAPVLTSNINLTGKYVVLTSANRRTGYSNKLTKAQKSCIKKILDMYEKEEFGLIARTNAAFATIEQLSEETEELKTKFTALKEKAKYKTCYSLLYKSPENYLRLIKDSYEGSLDEIVTDNSEIYNNVVSNSKEIGFDFKLKYYEDELLPLYKLYNIEGEIASALKERVWLKSGAYLVIQPTEALTVIDVNTGKYSGNKKLSETFLKINLEAAKECARQLRLRNISGIVIIDFIDMGNAEDRNELLDKLSAYLSKDPVKTTLVDMTKLGLVELTRKKVRKSLKEQLNIQLNASETEIKGK